MIWFIKILIQKLVDYINTSKSKFKYDIAQYSIVLAIFPINYLVFHYIFHSTIIAWIILFSIGSGRLLTAWIMERHNCDFGEGYITPLRYMSYTMVILLTFIAFFMLIRDGYENNSVTDRVKNTSITSTYVTSKKNETNLSIKPIYPLAFPMTQLQQKLHE